MLKILTISDVFVIGKRGVLVAPWLPVNTFGIQQLPTQVKLRFPNGASAIKKASFDIPRQTPPPAESMLVCMISNIAKSELPIGTEVWVHDKYANACPQTQAK